MILDYPVCICRLYAHNFSGKIYRQTEVYGTFELEAVKKRYFSPDSTFQRLNFAPEFRLRPDWMLCGGL